MRGFSGEEFNRLAALLKEKKQLAQQFLVLTEKQAGLLDEEDADGLVANLDQRQKIIEKIEGLHQGLNPLMQSYESFIEALGRDVPQGAVIRELNEGILEALRRCEKLDGENREKAKQLSEFFSAEVKRLSSSRKGIGSYQQSMTEPGIGYTGYFDKMQ